MKDIIPEPRLEGAETGVLTGFDRDGAPLVAIGEGSPVAALSTIALCEADAGVRLALLFLGNDPSRPLVIGRIMDAGKQGEVRRDGETIRIGAEARLELRCGKASIIMERDGRITIRGSTLVSHASGANRIRGGSINLN